MTPDESARFIDFDQYDEEIDDRPIGFQFGGEQFEINFGEVDGAIILRWMRRGIGPSSIPLLLEELLNEEDYTRMLATKQPWPKYEKLILWLIGELAGGLGNASTTGSSSSS